MNALIKLPCDREIRPIYSVHAHLRRAIGLHGSINLPEVGNGPGGDVQRAQQDGVQLTRHVCMGESSCLGIHIIYYTSADLSLSS